MKAQLGALMISALIIKPKNGSGRQLRMTPKRTFISGSCLMTKARAANGSAWMITRNFPKLWKDPSAFSANGKPDRRKFVSEK